MAVLSYPKMNLDRIITGMVAMGDPLYYEMAKISAQAFVRENSCDLALFTDKPEYFAGMKDYGRLKIVDYNTWFNKGKDIFAVFDQKIEHGRADFPYYDHFHLHLYIGAFIPMLQWYAEENGYDWCLKIDSDSYFVGDMFAKLRTECQEWAYLKDFFSVSQCHPEMCFFHEGGMPTAGFMMWRVKSWYCERYIVGFTVNEQQTYWNRMNDGEYLRHFVLQHPGYHFVYPFGKNEHFTKENAMKFLPAYFHLGGTNLIKQVQLMDKWFNPESQFTLTDWRG